MKRQPGHRRTFPVEFRAGRDAFPCLGVPEAEGVIAVSARRKAFPVGGKGHRPHGGCVPFQRPQQSARLRCPELDGPVRAPGRQKSSARIKGDAGHGSFVSVRDVQQLAGRCFPDADLAVFAPRGQKPARRIVCHAGNGTVMFVHRMQQSAADRLPQVESTIKVSSSHDTSFRVKDDVTHPVGVVAAHGVEQFTVGDIPKSDRAILAGTSQRLAPGVETGADVLFLVFFQIMQPVT